MGQKFLFACCLSTFFFFDLDRPFFFHLPLPFRCFSLRPLAWFRALSKTKREPQLLLARFLAAASSLARLLKGEERASRNFFSR